MPDSPLPVAGHDRGALLTVQELACLHSAGVVFGGLSFRLRAGEAMRLTGPNGSGKSSLLRILAGLCPAHAGTVLWRAPQAAAQAGDESGGEAGVDPADMVYIGHRNALTPGMSGRENLTFWGGLALGAAPAPERIAQALSPFNLAPLADVPVAHLSAGQCRRMALARLCLSAAADKPLWLLDEPEVGLDAESRHRLDLIIAGHLRDGGMAIIAGHREPGSEGATVLDMRRFAPPPPGHRTAPESEIAPAAERGRS